MPRKNHMTNKNVTASDPVHRLFGPALKACPFCGKQPSPEYCQRRYDFDFAIECECGACLSQCEWAGGPGQESREKTIEQWNTRAGECALKREREELLAIADRTREQLAARVRWLECKLVDVAEAIESEPPTVVADTIWHDGTETLCDALRRWATNGDMRPNAKDDLAPASGAQVQRLVGPDLGGHSETDLHAFVDDSRGDCHCCGNGPSHPSHKGKP